MGREDYIILVREDDHNGKLVSACIFCNILSHLRSNAIFKKKKKYTVTCISDSSVMGCCFCCRFCYRCRCCCYFVGFIVVGVADAVGFWINPIDNETALSQ